jgi:hypothetical protein
LVTGNGTGASTLVTGNGTGATIQVTGNGTGAEAVNITLPNGTGMSMEISLGCHSADVTIVDDNFAPVVTFQGVAVLGNTGLCEAGYFDSAFVANPGQDFRRDR